MSKVSYYPLKVIKKELETKKVCSLYLEIPKAYQSLFLYKTAQFLTFRFIIEGKEYIRSYSIASSPFRPEGLRVSVGRVKKGVVSNYILDQIQTGDTVESQVPLGEFFKTPKSLSLKDYILFSAGIGITPLFSIIKSLLETQSARCLHLIFSIRQEEDFIYKKELMELQNQFKTKFFIQTIISQKEGRLDDKKLSRLLKAWDKSSSVFYLCGPRDYMNKISQFLLQSEVLKENIHTEDFNVVPIRGPQPDENSIFVNADQSEESEPKHLKTVLSGESIEINLNREKSLLEQLIDRGYNPPFSCTSGSCMTCMAKLIKGKVFQLEEGVLDEENIKNKEILTCQCYPLSETIHIDYDHL